MDELIQELNRLRIARNEASRDYWHTINETSRRERTLLAAIQQRQRADQQIRNNTRRNPIRVGDIVRITNDYQHGEGITGRVSYVTRKMVELHCLRTRKFYKRAWWNMENPTNGQRTITTTHHLQSTLKLPQLQSAHTQQHGATHMTSTISMEPLLIFTHHGNPCVNGNSYYACHK